MKGTRPGNETHTLDPDPDDHNWTPWTPEIHAIQKSSANTRAAKKSFFPKMNSNSSSMIESYAAQIIKLMPLK